MYKSKKIAVVVPAHNEERLIREVIKTVPSFVDRIIVVDDASSDGTPEVLESLPDSRLIVVRNHRNKGAGYAMLTGYKKACEENCDIAAIMAGDGQMDPAILDRIIDPVADLKADYSKGNRLNRVNRKGMPGFRLFGNTMLTFIIKIASGYYHISDPLNGYTAINQETLNKLDLDSIEQGYSFETDLLIKLNACNARVANVDMPARYGNERSEIVYHKFILKLSWVILRDYLWRLRTKYVKDPLQAKVARKDIKETLV